MTVAILCGGRSQRLGQDKGLYRPLDDEPLAARAVRLLGSVASEVLLVVRDEQQSRHYQQALAPWLACNSWRRVRIVADSTAGWVTPSSAASGLFTALKQSAYDRVAVLPVDQVGVRAYHLDTLAVAADLCEEFQAASFEDDRGALPFPSLWTRACTPWVERGLTANDLSVRGLLVACGTRAVPAGAELTALSVNGNTEDDMRAYFGTPLNDSLGRRMHYLRFSLTEACNMSCTYCLPDGFPEWYRHKARLAPAQIEVLLKGFRELGFRKVRFTGGEPTVHPGCLDAIRTARMLGYEEIALSTNGSLMTGLQEWADAGLTQLNFSLDTLDPAKFRQITKSNKLGHVLDLIEESLQTGFETKINAVLMRSVNGSVGDIESMIDWALERPLTLRFIELMSTRLNASFSDPERVLGSELIPLLTRRGLLEGGDHRQDSHGPDTRGPASVYGSRNFPGRIGLINPMSCNFCSKCNRLRVTARGGLKICLFGDQDHPLDLSSPAAVAAGVRQCIEGKPARHYLETGNVGNVSTFRTIGG